MSNPSTSLRTVVTGKPDPSANPAVAFKNMLESRRGEIAAALPKHITADRVIRLALTEFTKNPGLRECTPQSIYAGIIQASQLGLEIGVLGQAYLVPYNNKVKGKNGQADKWRKDAQFIPGYKGLISLARRSGEVTSIETHVVYEQDHFDLVLGITSKVEHKPFLDGNRGKPKLVYGVAHFKDGGYHFEWMSIGDVNKIRDRSKAKDNGPWVTDYDQMVRKTLVRRMANYLPMSIELSAAIQVDEAVTAGKSATIEGDFNVITNDDEGEDVPALDAATVDPSTGEIMGTSENHASNEGAKAEAGEQQGTTEKPQAAATRKPRAAAAACADEPAVTYAHVINRLQIAFGKGDWDLLQVEADLIKHVKDDLQRSELTAEFKRMAAELQGAGEA